MPVPTTRDEVIELLRKCKLFEPEVLDPFLTTDDETDPARLIERMQTEVMLTGFQATQILKGKHKGFVLGKYKLQDRIGMGGMGQVFLALHSTMNRHVAIKVLPPERAKNEFAKRRFMREAKATGQLNHPNLVRAFDVDSDQDVLFLVLEYVNGLSFQELVVRGGPLPTERAAQYLWQAASGLHYLHEQGMVHRDVKPANLMIDRSGCVKLLDLGLVRSETESDDLTRKEDVKFLGTADYLAPEQAVSCTTVDGRADQYSLGATAYFMLTGTPPFGGDTVAQKLMAHQTNEIKLLHVGRPNVPIELSAIIHKMMSRKSEDRYTSMADVLIALTPWASVILGETPLVELPLTGRPGQSAQSATVNLEPKATIRSGTKTPGREVPQSSGSGIRFYCGGSGSGSGIPGLSSGTKSNPPLIITPPPAAANAPVSTPVKISEPSAPKVKAKSSRPPVLPAAATHQTHLPATATPSPIATTPVPVVPSVIPKPVLTQAPFQTPVKTVKVKELPSNAHRSWYGIAAGFLLVVMVTAWTAVTKTSGRG